MGQPEAAQSCQWWVALLFQAGSQAWVWPEGVPLGVQMAFRVTSLEGIVKLTSGTLRLARVTPVTSQAAKVRPLLLPARMATFTPSSYS